MNARERILYADECVFTKAIIPKLDYAHKHTNNPKTPKENSIEIIV